MTVFFFDNVSRMFIQRHVSKKNFKYVERGSGIGEGHIKLGKGLYSTSYCRWSSPPSFVILSPYRFKYPLSIYALIILALSSSHHFDDVNHPPVDSNDQAVFSLLVQPFTLNRSLT